MVITVTAMALQAHYDGVLTVLPIVSVIILIALLITKELLESVSISKLDVMAKGLFCILIGEPVKLPRVALIRQALKPVIVAMTCVFAVTAATKVATIIMS